MVRWTYASARPSLPFPLGGKWLEKTGGFGFFYIYTILGYDTLVGSGYLWWIFLYSYLPKIFGEYSLPPTKSWFSGKGGGVSPI